MPKLLYVVRAIWASPENRLVFRTECAIHAVKPAIPRAIVIQIDAKHAAFQTIETLAASNALSTSVRNAKARWIQKGTISTTAPEAPYVKHAAAQAIETLRASNVLSTSARNAKERWIQKGTIRITAPRC